MRVQKTKKLNNIKNEQVKKNENGSRLSYEDRFCIKQCKNYIIKTLIKWGKASTNTKLTIDGQRVLEGWRKLIRNCLMMEVQNAICKILQRFQ